MDRIDLPGVVVDFRRTGAGCGRKPVMPGAPAGASARSPYIWTKIGILRFAVLPAADEASQVDDLRTSTTVALSL